MATLQIPVAAADHSQGEANAPVTLLEYGDYECPACGAVYPIVKAVQKHFGKKLKFVFNFPLTSFTLMRRARRRWPSLPARTRDFGDA